MSGTGLYLADHPPAIRQFRTNRRAEVAGSIVVHTAENHPDLTLPDHGAEGVARFISRRTDTAGSYHTVVDSDSAVRLGSYSWEMFGEGTGGNRWALHLSFACQADQWPNLPGSWVSGAITNGASAARDMAEWVKESRGITIPAKRITAAQYRAGAPGFIGHAEVDPRRRSDPGAGFPWETFLDAYTTGTPPGGTEMVLKDEVAHWQRWLNTFDVGLAKLDDDGIRGPLTEAYAAKVRSDFGSGADGKLGEATRALFSTPGARAWRSALDDLT